MRLRSELCCVRQEKLPRSLSCLPTEGLVGSSGGVWAAAERGDKGAILIMKQRVSALEKVLERVLKVEKAASVAVVQAGASGGVPPKSEVKFEVGLV